MEFCVLLPVQAALISVVILLAHATSHGFSKFISLMPLLDFILNALIEASI